jgi:nicotinate-nucleotide adenylyltransferase
MRRSSPVRFGSIRAQPPPASRGQRIGLLGGSFNPPHAAHVLISETALKRLGLDRVWWLVTPGNPLKSHGELAPLAERMAACRRLARDRRIVVTGLEAQLPSPFTAATVDFLKLRRPGVRFVWLMGADNLAGFHRWRQWREIARSVPIAVIDRPRQRLAAVASRAGHWMAPHRLPEGRARALPSRRPPALVLLTGRLSPLSSTELRRRQVGPPRPTPSA